MRKVPVCESRREEWIVQGGCGVEVYLGALVSCSALAVAARCFWCAKYVCKRKQDGQGGLIREATTCTLALMSAAAHCQLLLVRQVPGCVSRRGRVDQAGKPPAAQECLDQPQGVGCQLLLVHAMRPSQRLSPA